MPRNEPKRHHYVPQFYQQGFADEENRLWVYDRRARRYFQAHPNTVCCERELYTVDPEGTRNRQIESVLLSKIDGLGAAAIRLAEERGQLDDPWKEYLSIFMAQQVTRTPVFREVVSRNVQAVGERIMTLSFADVDRARQSLEDYERLTGNRISIGITSESMVNSVKSGQFSVRATERPFLEYMITLGERLATWFTALEWEVVRAPEGTGFIICDYPFVVAPPRLHPENIGLGFQGSVKYFPLTRSVTA